MIWKILLLIGVVALAAVLLVTCSLITAADDQDQERDLFETGEPAPTRRSLLPWARPDTPTPTRPPTLTPSPSPSPTPTRQPSPTPTRTPAPTATPAPTPMVNLLIQTCDTGVDIFNRMGEVTNAYITIQNVGKLGLTDVEVTMEASDEEEMHPDKSYSLGYFPSGYEMTLKLTVDTRNFTDTSIQVRLTSAEMADLTASKDSCRQRRPDRDILNSLGELFKLREIEVFTP